MITDSRYCEGLFNRDDWTQSWEFSPIKNIELVKMIRQLVEKINKDGSFEIRRVRGHNGIHLNEIADLVAKQAVILAKKQKYEQDKCTNQEIITKK